MAHRGRGNSADRVRRAELIVGDASDQGDTSSLSRLAWLSLPIVLLLVKRMLDSALSLRPAITPVTTPAVPAATWTGAYVSPRAIADVFAARSRLRAVDAPDGIVQTLWSRGLAPPKPPPEYRVELLLFCVFIYDQALGELASGLSDVARDILRESSRGAANSLLDEAQRPPMAADAWNQLVDRRFAEYSSDVGESADDPSSSKEYLAAMFAKVIRYASRSHIPNPRAAKVLFEFYGPELANARTTLTKSSLVDD
ncbi:MAG TPA: hypothetical protein VHV78_05280 [Gemmatimonadaceae bacterium]|nr:hypothetical protein [Gemmatimonadaceae bacterium]